MVVPTRIQTKCPNSIHDKNAPHSSALKGLALRIENHLKRTLSLCQNPFAADRSSSLVGRWGILGRCGRCRYFETESVRLSWPSSALLPAVSCSLPCVVACCGPCCGLAAFPSSPAFEILFRLC